MPLSTPAQQFLPYAADGWRLDIDGDGRIDQLIKLRILQGHAGTYRTIVDLGVVFDDDVTPADSLVSRFQIQPGLIWPHAANEDFLTLTGFPSFVNHEWTVWDPKHFTHGRTVGAPLSADLSMFDFGSRAVRGDGGGNQVYPFVHDGVTYLFAIETGGGFQVFILRYLRDRHIDVTCVLQTPER